jgi:hypothetical protein
MEKLNISFKKIRYGQLLEDEDFILPQAEKGLKNETDRVSDMVSEKGSEKLSEKRSEKLSKKGSEKVFLKGSEKGSKRVSIKDKNPAEVSGLTFSIIPPLTLFLTLTLIEI